jgi:predicted enzyme related to lactoylglutathione lyase
MARVTGIGGIFFRARDPKALAAWYSEHLGIKLEDWGGARMLWSDELPAGTGATAWSPFPNDTKYFGASGQAFMINYRVDDLDALLAKLAASGAAKAPHRQDDATGHFAWIMDPEGNRLELWQPLKVESKP